MMVEVFKTNIVSAVNAAQVLRLLAQSFTGYRANFDLDDCDRILRIAAANGEICSESVIKLLEMHGFYAELLPDE